jgi:hypothetical protein
MLPRPVGHDIAVSNGYLFFYNRWLDRSPLRRGNELQAFARLTHLSHNLGQFDSHSRTFIHSMRGKNGEEWSP